MIESRVGAVVYAVPERHKLRGNEYKPLLISAAGEYLPSVIRIRRKIGFELPYVGWMARELRPKFEYLMDSEIADRIFSYSYRQRVCKLLNQGTPPRALWGWGILLAWIDEYGVAF